ncbi:TPA_asm: DUF1642 domain-containing protein [Listeria monocytogenes]|nr:DUF1642 domain-containing protein [Listeria monocytogenes]
MKFEVGERVQFIEGNEVKTGKVLEPWIDKAYRVETKEEKSIILKEIRVAKLDQPEPVKVPKFVADLISDYEAEVLDFYSNQDNVLECILQDWKSDSFCAEHLDWITVNLITLIDAVRNGYVVEEDKKYYVQIVPIADDDDGYLNLYTDKDGSFYYNIGSSIEGNSFKAKFTEKEIKAIDEKLWAFAVPVEEVEAQ